MNTMTSRELEVLNWASRGLKNEEIARKLALQPKTIEACLSTIYLKLGVKNRAEAVVWYKDCIYRVKQATSFLNEIHQLRQSGKAQEAKGMLRVLMAEIQEALGAGANWKEGIMAYAQLLIENVAITLDCYPSGAVYKATQKDLELLQKIGKEQKEPSLLSIANFRLGDALYVDNKISDAISRLTQFLSPRTKTEVITKARALRVLAVSAGIVKDRDMLLAIETIAEQLHTQELKGDELLSVIWLTEGLGLGFAYFDINKDAEKFLDEAIQEYTQAEQQGFIDKRLHVAIARSQVMAASHGAWGLGLHDIENLAEKAELEAISCGYLLIPAQVSKILKSIE